MLNRDSRPADTSKWQGIGTLSERQRTTIRNLQRLDEPLPEGSEGAALRVGSIDGVDLQGVSTMSVVALSPELSDCSPLGPWLEFCHWLAPKTGDEVTIELRFTLSDQTRVGDHELIAYGVDIPTFLGLSGHVHTMVTALPAPAPRHHRSRSSPLSRADDPISRSSPRRRRETAT